MNKRLTAAIIIMLACTIMTSLGQLFLKLSADSLSLNLFELIANYWLIGGVIFYGTGAVLLIIALKFGELSFVYPLVSLSFIWVALLSVKFLNEGIGPIKIVGMMFILSGVSLIGVGAKNG